MKKWFMGAAIFEILHIGGIDVAFPVRVSHRIVHHLSPSLKNIKFPITFKTCGWAYSSY